jgi:hypothetical protein
LAGHGEPIDGKFQVNDRNEERIFMKDLNKIVNIRRAAD